jgi:SnoaL-like polyketide cyclase
MLEVPASLSDRWVALGREVRERVESFFGPAGTARAAVADDGELPASFVDDLAGGGPQLRAAFPGLARRVVAIEGRDRDRIEIRIACEGAHDGDFYGFLRASGRRVRFDERHELVVRGGAIAHRIAIDLRAIVRQMRGQSQDLAPRPG